MDNPTKSKILTNIIQHDVYVNWPGSFNITVTTAPVVSVVVYSFAPLFGLDGYPLIALATVALASTVTTSIVAGIALEVKWISKLRSGLLRSIVCISQLGAMGVIAVVYVLAQHMGLGGPGTQGDILKAATLAILVMISAMLGVKFGIRYGGFSIGDAISTSRGVRRPNSITVVTIRKWLDWIALATLFLVFLVAWFQLPDLPTHQAPDDLPTYQVPRDTLFMASATIMGFAAFGSALSALRPSVDLIKGITSTLIPVIAVQTVFMMSLLGYVYFPAGWWVGMTGVLVMLAVFAMVANNILPTKTDDGAGPFRYL